MIIAEGWFVSCPDRKLLYKLKLEKKDVLFLATAKDSGAGDRGRRKRLEYLLPFAWRLGHRGFLHMVNKGPRQVSPGKRSTILLPAANPPPLPGSVAISKSHPPQRIFRERPRRGTRASDPGTFLSPSFLAPQKGRVSLPSCFCLY